jgi:CHAD domain-containing protein
VRTHLGFPGTKAAYRFMTITLQRSKTLFRKAERDLARLSREFQPEVVHSFRTTSRRIQVLLEQLAPKRDRSQKKLLKLLGRIRKHAGKVRDLDVQLSALRSLKVPLEPRRKTQLAHRLIELREKQEKKLGKLLTKETIRETEKRLRRASKSLERDTLADPLTTARKMMDSVALPTALIDEEMLRSYRTVVKQARYAAEFAAPSDQAAHFMGRLKGLQEAIGNWHDWQILTQTATQHLGDVHQSSLVAALHNVTGGKYRHAVTALAASLSSGPGPRLTEAGPSRNLNSDAAVAQQTATAA